MPIIVGITIENIVQPILPVSFLIVRQVVEQGKWKMHITIVQIAVVSVQPFCVSNAKVPHNLQISQRTRGKVRHNYYRYDGFISRKSEYKSHYNYTVKTYGSAERVKKSVQYESSELSAI